MLPYIKLGGKKLCQMVLNSSKTFFWTDCLKLSYLLEEINPLFGIIKLLPAKENKEDVMDLYTPYNYTEKSVTLKQRTF